jgi:kumamolisin
MESETNEKELPQGYAKLPGSERRASKDAELLGPADAAETFKVTIVLRRRPDGQPIPSFDYFAKTPLAKRPRLSMDEFAGKYGAHPDELVKVADFAGDAGLQVVETHAARRTVVVSGTAGQFSKAFSVQLGRYQRSLQPKERRRDGPVTENYRGREGFISVPESIAPYIIGIFGLDNRNITRRNGGDPINTANISVQLVTQLYNFPTNSAEGQTIAIFSEAGYLVADISDTFGGELPKVSDINVDASNGKYPDLETTQDICIAAAAAPGASIVVYFTTYTQMGWVDLIQRVIHPEPGEALCSVLSSSFYVLNSDDAASLDIVSQDWINSVTMAFEDAAVQNVTVCVASGDSGTESNVGDGKAHVQYPASDPWVLGAGGTTIGNIVGNTFDEYVWNDDWSYSCYGTTTMGLGATGGGVSGYFPLPSYQNGVNVPVSNNDRHVGRGVPDVAANASPNSGYPIIVNGMPCVGNGTSASAPLWAGLIAVLNAALGQNIGFINPYIYQFGSAAFNDITGAPGPADNGGILGVAGYPAGPGWDACTGWGSPNGLALLNAFKNAGIPDAYISGGYQSPDIILTDVITLAPVPVGGVPGGLFDTLLAPNTGYGFSANVHNDSATAANNVEVRFWAMPGGVGLNGNMIGVPQVVSIPPYGTVNVKASADFMSAAPGRHQCAVVSLYNPASGCTIQATTAQQIPDPGVGGYHSCSAWRNTDSMIAIRQGPFGFVLGFGIPEKSGEPIVVKFHPVHVPAGWAQMDKVREINKVLGFVGAKNIYPLYLLPEINKNFAPAAITTKLASPVGARIEEKGANLWHVFAEGDGTDVSLEVTGDVPQHARKGDILLMYVAANYPRVAGRGPRLVEFLEVIHIADDAGV